MSNNYLLNVDELNLDFLNLIKKNYKGKLIEISIVDNNDTEDEVFSLASASEFIAGYEHEDSIYDDYK